MKSMLTGDQCKFAIGSLRCVKTACSIVHDRNKDSVMKVCSEHRELVVGDNQAEHDVSCPNCSCHHGVG